MLVALSGGVDSAVAALRERERGAEVVAVTLKLWADQRTDATRSCCSPLAVLGARRLAHSLDMAHFTLDLEADFRAEVVDEFIAGYRAGRTPNPCVICNGELRIDAMLDLARRLGCSALATGHYARLADDGDGPLLRAAADAAKDQTYMLSGLRPESLARLRFPLAELTKPEVRELAAAAGLPVASKAESQDLCFLAGEGKRSFLARHGGLAGRPGAIVDRGGRRLGSTAATTSSPWASGGGSGSAARSRCTCCARTRPRTRSWSAPARSSPAVACTCARRRCTAREGGSTGAPALSREAARLRAPARPRRRP